MIKSFPLLAIFCLAIFYCQLVAGQDVSDTMTGPRFTLDDCIIYALEHQPALKQSLIDKSIQDANIKIALSAWLPQASLYANVQHYFQLPTIISTNFANPGTGKVTFVSGVHNTSSPQLVVTENLFNNEVLYAVTTAKYYRRQSEQNITRTKIDLVVNVSKAYYDVLVTQIQIGITQEDIARLERSLKDAYSRYEAGIVDKVDYKRAMISLNNSKSQLKRLTEDLSAKYAYLKQLMGYQEYSGFSVRTDTARMLQEMVIDTTIQLQYENRIEYQQLQTTKVLQQQNTRYFRNGFLPSVSAFYNYFNVYQDDQFDRLYDNNYPYSYIGLSFSLPIFQGFRRLQNIRRSRLQERRIDWDEVNLKLQINSEYKQALGHYKSDIEAAQLQKANVAIAREVYNVVFLQYREGIKEYLEVVTAETDLKSSEILFLDAVYRVLTSKLDLQRALGLVLWNY